MKKFFTLLLALAAISVFTPKAFAQPGTDGDGFLVQVTIGSRVYYYENKACGYGVAQFGADVVAPDEPEGEVVYGRTAAQDSFLCEPATNALAGKFALCSRGPVPGTPCNFSLKAYNAQLGGAKACVIMNHYANASDDACTIVTMSAGISADLVTIPVIFLCRQASELIREALDAGIRVDMKFVFPRMYDATAAYHYSTPVDHVDTLDHVTVHYVNRSGAVQTNVKLNCEISEPGGTKSTLEVVLPEVAIAQDVEVTFPPYLPKKQKGVFTAKFYNDRFSESRDTLTRVFIQTDHTWSTATFVNDPGGVGPTDADFATGEFKYQCGSLCLTADNPTNRKVTHISFGISNIADVFVPGGFSGENDILVFLYDGDPNNDGTIDFQTSWDEMSNQQVAFGTYTMTGNEADGELVSAELIDNVTGDPGFVMKRNHPYYASILYNGLLAGHGKSVRFMNSNDEHYLGFPTTPISVRGQMFGGGWAGAIVMIRLRLDGFDPANDTDARIPTSQKTVVLADNKVNIAPNPANDLININLKLDAVNQAVTVRMMDMSGRIYDYQTVKNFQEGQISFDTQAIPSGLYMVWITTSEGTAVKRVAICH